MPSAKAARYGPSDRYNPPPGAGMCLSVFAVVRRGSKVLVGRPAPGPRWERDWLPALARYDAAERRAQYQALRLPSTYLREFEHPEAALTRVLRQQLRATSAEAAGPSVHSYTARSDWYPGQRHWDLAFAYDVRAKLPAKPGPWWAELAWRDPAELEPSAFGWNGDFIRDLGLAQGGARARRAAPPRRG